jgi:hypothetical protein
MRYSLKRTVKKAIYVQHTKPTEFVMSSTDPGRAGASRTTFTSPTELAAALRRAEAAHAEYEKRTGQPDAAWADWYAAHMLAEQAGKRRPI